MSKLKVTLSKLSQGVPARIEGTSVRCAQEAREVAGQFYRKNLPKMSTIPNKMDPSPRLNVWLWVLGYLSVHWTDVEKSLVKSGDKDGTKLTNGIKSLTTWKVFPPQQQQQ